MLEKLKNIGKGSVIVFAVLGVVAIVTTAIKMRRARADMEDDDTVATSADNEAAE